MNAKSGRESRARRMLFWGVLAFVGIQLGIGLALDYAVPLLRFPSARAILGRLEKSKLEPDVVILGSSRAQGGFLEAEVKAALERHTSLSAQVCVLNAAVPGGDSVAQERVLEGILASGARPRLVLAEVSPEFFNWYNFCEGFNVERLVRWSDLPEHLSAAVVTGHGGRLLAGKLVPGHQYRERLWELVTVQGPLTTSTVRFSPPAALVPGTAVAQDSSSPTPPISPEVTDLMARGRVLLRDNWLRRYQVSPLNVTAAKRLARRCRDAGCELILFSPPVTSGHRSAYTPEIESQYQAMLAALGCRHVDCRDWLADGYFYDMHHVTQAGGMELSRQFTKRVLVPEWRR